MNKVYIGIPSYDGQIHYGLMDAIVQASPKNQIYAFQNANQSWLTKNFNALLCSALNDRDKGVTHFCMIHADIVPLDRGWLDEMLEIMMNVRADVLSVVSPIKNGTGLTSTAVDEMRPSKLPRALALWQRRRLTMLEIYKQAETFTDPKLLINTGLMLIDIRNTWIENVSFRFEDSIIKEDGKFYAVGMPEDWLFSRDAKRKGASLFVTRAIRLKHIGPTAYHNDKPFGTKKTDD